MFPYTVITNNHHRPVLGKLDLTDKELEQFDYIPRDSCAEEYRFFRYKGEVYDLYDIPRAPLDLEKLGWLGFISDSYWSGIAVKYAGERFCDDAVIVARVLVECV